MTPRYTFDWRKWHFSQMFPNFRKNKREILPRNLPLGLNWSFLSSRSINLLLYRALGFRKATFLFDARDLYTNNNAANRGVSFIASLVNPIRRSIRLAEGHGNTNTSFFPFHFLSFFSLPLFFVLAFLMFIAIVQRSALKLMISTCRFVWRVTKSVLQSLYDSLLFTAVSDDTRPRKPRGS